MDLRNTVYVASGSVLKSEAARSVYKQVNSLSDTKSGVPEQPISYEEIKRGAYNRLASAVGVCSVVAYESGILITWSAFDATCCVLRTNLGIFEHWVYHEINNKNKFNEWKKAWDDELCDLTFGQYAFPETHQDWYLQDGGDKSRVQLLAEATLELQQQYEARMRSIPITVIPAPLKDFRNVNFLDLQYPLRKHPNELSETTFRLANNLLYDTVVCLDARGFLLVGEFMRHKIPIVLARKPGKLPDEELIVEYKKEYGVDRLCIEKSALSPGNRVVIIDDIIATGGTMRAVEQLVKLANAEVVAFVAPYALRNPDGTLMCNDLAHNTRFLCDQNQAAKAMETKYLNEKVVLYSPPERLKNTYPLKMIFPPSMYALDKYNMHVPIRWGRFARSSNIWFNPLHVKGQDILVFMDPANTQESFDVLQLLAILHRKDPARVRVVIPFLEYGTQDRIEYDGNGWQSLAGVDTVAKIMQQNKIITFDLHAEQSQFAFYDLRFASLVAGLWAKYVSMNLDTISVFPDDGAAKRFGKLCKNYITFRKVRIGDKRVVSTDAKVLPQNYVIIDDMVRSGGTMYEVANYLLTNGAKNVDALFAHAPFEPAAARNLAIFRDVWTTNTCVNNVPQNWVKLDVYDWLIQNHDTL